MEKRKILYLLLVMVLCYSLFSRIAGAGSSSQISIPSQGSIIYSPSPSQNLAPIPDGWSLVYPDNPQYCYLDYSVTHNGHVSIRIEPDYVGTRECDSNFFPAKPGDHIVIKCWIRIEDNGDRDMWSGARIGIDLIGDYDATIGRYPCLYDLGSTYVNWGTQDWVQRTIDFIVPSDYFTLDKVTGETITPTQISAAGMWMQVWSSTYGGTESGNAWFADAEFYINP